MTRGIEWTMIREDRLVAYLEKQGGACAADELQFKMGLSDNTVRSAVKIINLNKERNGFHIVYERNVGYRLIVNDMDRYEVYRASARRGIDLTSVDSRVAAILFYLLQNRGYTTLDDLISRMEVSRTTLIKDLERVEGELAGYSLALERRRHYGIKVIGDERAYRRAFTRYVADSEFYLEPVQDYRSFIDRISNREFKDRLWSILSRHGIVLSDLAFDNVFEHYAITCYRITLGNYVKGDDTLARDDSTAFYAAACDLARAAKDCLGIDVPDIEVCYLKIVLQSKTRVDSIPVLEKGRLRAQVESILMQVDEEYRTQFARDASLIDGVVLHVFPLLVRVNHDFQFQNPLINRVRSDYANIFTVALRFAQLLCERYGLKAFSEDEVGFIALHLAASAERGKRKQLEKIKRIVVICSTGAGTAALIKIKLESIFAQAEISTIAERAIGAYDARLPDLILSTVPFESQYKGVPVIQIKNLLDEEELERIKDVTALTVSHQDIDEYSINVLPLFDAAYFQVLDGGDYIDIISRQAQAMVRGGNAPENYPALVLERERLYPTIFMDGVATPHPIRLNAIENVVGVTLLKRPIMHEGREVRIIFLICLEADSFFLHSEIQKLIIKIIDDGSLRQRVLSCESFESFVYEIKRAM